jgi:hypothetical protein
VIRAAETDTPDQTRFMDMPLFDVPAASQYAATTQQITVSAAVRLTGRLVAAHGERLAEPVAI